MTVDRREVDSRLADRGSVHHVTALLGLQGEGQHFFCPGCQPAGEGTPELLIKDGHFECFRCGALGDVVGLVKLARNCDLDTALGWLEQETGRRLS